MQTTLARSAVRPASKQTSSSSRVAGGATAAPRRACCNRRMAARASSLDTNFFVNAIESAAAISIPVAVSIVTAEKSDEEFVRTKSVEGLIPIGAAVAADAVAHSIPGEFESFSAFDGFFLEFGLMSFFFSLSLGLANALESSPIASL